MFTIDKRLVKLQPSDVNRPMILIDLSALSPNRNIFGQGVFIR